MTITTAKIMATISNSSSAAIKSEIVMNAINLKFCCPLNHITSTYVYTHVDIIGIKIVLQLERFTVMVGWSEL